MKKTHIGMICLTILLLAFSASAVAQSNIPPAVAPDNPSADDQVSLPPQTGNVQQGILIPPPPQAGVKQNPGSPGILDLTLPMPDVRIIDNPDDAGGKMLIYSIWGTKKKPYTDEQFKDLQERVDHIWVTRAASINSKYENAVEIPLDRNATAIDEIGDRTVFYRVKVEKGRTFKYSIVIGPVKAIDNGGPETDSPVSLNKSNSLPYIIAGILVACVMLILFVRRKKNS